MATQIISGTFTNTASTPYFVPIVPQISKFYLKNLSLSGIGGSLTSDRITEAWFLPGSMTAGTATCYQNGTVGNGLAPLNLTYLSAGGFTVVDGANQGLGAAVAISSFTPGSTTVFVTGSAHGLVVGDNVVINNMTSAPELGGVVMTVTAVGSTTQFTTLLDSSNSVTSVGSVRKVGNAAYQNNSLYYPQLRGVASISKASQAVVTLLVAQNYHVGDVVRFQIPTTPQISGTNGYGMPELNSGTNGYPVQATIVAVNNAVGTQTVTIDIDTSAYTAFDWPGTGFYPGTFPQMIPQGEGNLNNLTGVTPSPFPYGNQNVLSFAQQNTGHSGILIGAGSGAYHASTPGIIGSTTDKWYWECTTVAQAY